MAGYTPGYEPAVKEDYAHGKAALVHCHTCGALMDASYGAMCPKCEDMLMEGFDLATEARVANVEDFIEHADPDFATPWE